MCAGTRAAPMPTLTRYGHKRWKQSGRQFPVVPGRHILSFGMMAADMMTNSLDFDAAALIAAVAAGPALWRAKHKDHKN